MKLTVAGRISDIQAALLANLSSCGHSLKSSGEKKRFWEQINNCQKRDANENLASMLRTKREEKEGKDISLTACTADLRGYH
jgi:hypothetical protein